MAPLNSATKTPTILLVDDSIEELRVLVSMLKSARYNLIISNNGQDGLTRAALFQPDLIILDIGLPRMNGLAVCKLLKSDVRTAGIPVIFLTAANDPTSRIEGFQAGAVDYIAKPPLAEEVLLRIAVHLKRDASLSFFPFSGHLITETTPHAPALKEEYAADLTDKCAAVNLVRQMVASDLRRNWTIEAISEKTGIPRRKLGNIFREALGVTVIAWIREYRMQQASKWLTQSNLSVQGISDDLGFESPANFSTAFKDRFGISPREFRQQLTKKSTDQAPELSVEIT